MATFALTDAQILLHSTNLTSVSNEVSVEVSSDELDATTFGSGGAKVRAGGLKDFTAGVKVYADPSVIDATLPALIAAASDLAFSVSPTSTAGDAVYSARGASLDNFSAIETVGELRAAELNIMGRNARGLVRGTVIRALTTATGNGTGTAYLIGAASSSQYIWSALHCTAFSGGGSPTLTVTIQSSTTAGFPSPTTVHTHTALTTTGANWAETIGPETDTYYRINWTLTGASPSATFFVALGIV